MDNERARALPSVLHLLMWRAILKKGGLNCSLVFLAGMLAVLAFTLVPRNAAAGDPAFQAWLDGLWPEARQAGVSRRTFEMATRGLDPDLSLPDLLLPGRPEPPSRGQPEFLKTPADYLSEAALRRLAEQGRRLLTEHRATLARIERQYGVPPAIVLAIWGRETAFGQNALGYNAIRVLATQAYLGRRKDHFRQELLAAFKILEEGHVTLEKMRSSWAGAMGLTQLLPTEFYKYAIDFDGDGRRDIWNSAPDALAAAARQLLAKGWQPGRRWAYEVRAPKNVDCSIAEPDARKRLGDWLKAGFRLAYDRLPFAEELEDEASLLMPAGIYGPAFLTPKNYFVIKDYNFSDLYVLFVGQLSDRILEGRGFETPWAKIAQLASSDVEKMQRNMSRLGLYRDKIDGRAGMKTRAALGIYQKANGLRLDCWPTPALLEHMSKQTP